MGTLAGIRDIHLNRPARFSDGSGVEGNSPHGFPETGYVRGAPRGLVRLGVLALLLSSFWAGSVDVSGRLQRRAWEREGRAAAHPGEDEARQAMAWLVEEAWFRNLVTTDPAMALRAAERCVVVSEQPGDCKGLFERAISGNRRLSAAALGLADLAEQADEPERAREIFRTWEPADRSFAFLWSHWNFRLRAGDRTGFRAMALAVAEKAPAQFRGDFPLLRLAGIPAERVVQRLSERGSWERAFGYVDYLSSVGDPGAAALAAPLFRKAGTPEGAGGEPAVSREQGRAWTERFVGDCLSRRSGYASAAALWRAAMDVGFLPDRRTNPEDDAALNSNPRFEQPFLGRGFDWSISDEEFVEYLRADAGTGMRIHGRAGVRDGTVLLSKLVTLPADGQAVRVRVEQAGCDGGSACGELEWVAFDAKTGRTLGTAKPAPVFPEGQTAGNYAVLLPDLHSGSAEPLEAIYAGLVYRRRSAGAGRDFQLQLREVRFEIVGER